MSKNISKKEKIFLLTSNYYLDSCRIIKIVVIIIINCCS